MGGRRHSGSITDAGFAGVLRAPGRTALTKLEVDDAEGVPLDAWARFSARYDRQLWLERAAVRAVLDLADTTASERLLDLGTGTGIVLRDLARRPGRPRDAVGVDASAEMLAQVPSLPDGWDLLLGDARALPFGAGHFDVVIASYVLHVLPSAALPTVLAELARVLRSGGRLGSVTPTLPPGGVLRAVASRADSLGRRAPARFGGLRAFDPRPALEQAGFTAVRARISLRGYPSLCVLAQAPEPAAACVS